MRLKILTREGDKFVDSLHDEGGLSVHRVDLIEEIDGYRVTHTASGYAISPVFEREDHAVVFLHRMLPAIDWTLPAVAISRHAKELRARRSVALIGLQEYL